MNDPGITRGEILGLIVRLSLASVVTFLSVKWILKHVDPTNKSKNQARKVAEEQLKRINSNRSPVQISNLSDYELMIAAHLISPQDIKISWNDIAGLEDLIRDLRETVILPIQRKDLFAFSELTTAPKGVLLHGPPGCGKTLIAKATAREAGTYFINLDLSILTDKWYGESQKLAAAVFSLAIKLQPCIIFIDEIDSFLRARSSTDHEATAMMKAQFMSLWDGLITDPNCTVVIMGATNRPQDLDRAILRRLPATFHIPLPNAPNRRQILNLILERENLSDDVNIEEVARLTEGFSGSDLHELCRNAAVNRIRSYFRELSGAGAAGENGYMSNTVEITAALRPIEMTDLMASYRKMAESKRQCNPLAAQQPRIELD